MSQAQIYSQGFRTYTGTRTGHIGAIRALQKQSLRHALGLGRKFRHKLVPIFVMVLAYIPVIVFVGVVVVAGIFGGPNGQDIAEELLPSFAEFFGWINFAVIIMAGYVGPLLLSSDRRNGMLGVYLASPLTRLSYILGKLWATFIMIMLVCFVPPLVLLIALTAQGIGPDGIVDFFKTLLQVLVGSTLIGFFYSLISLAISSITDRTSVSWISYFVGVAGSGEIITTIANANSSLTWLQPFDLNSLPNELAKRTLGERGTWSPTVNSTTSMWLVWLLISALGAGVIWFQYRRLLVRR